MMAVKEVRFEESFRLGRAAANWEWSERKVVENEGSTPREAVGKISV